MMNMQSSINNSEFKRKSEAQRRILVILFCLVAIISAGTRDINNLPEGNDTAVYHDTYNELSRTSWHTLINNFSLFSTQYEGRDSGYPIFVKVTQLICDDFTFFMFLVATMFMTQFGMLVYKYVKSFFGIILSFLIFFALFDVVILSFMRQAITMSIVFYALRYIVVRDWKRYFGIMLIALSLHTSALVAIPYYFLPNLSKTKKWIFITIAMSPFLLYFSKLLVSSFLAGTLYEQFVSGEIVSPINYIVFVAFISGLAYLYFEKIKSIKDYELLISAAIGSILILPIVFWGNSLLRISYYYVIILIPLLPCVIDIVKIRLANRHIIYYVFISFFLLYILK